MATISNNTKGNKYHDSETGEFTSPGNASVGRSEQNNNLNDIAISYIALKEGIDLEELKAKIERKKQDNIEKNMPLDYFVKKGNDILGFDQYDKGIVNFRSDTDILVAKDLVRALGDVHNDFPLIINPNFLHNFGNQVARNDFYELHDKNWREFAKTPIFDSICKNSDYTINELVEEYKRQIQTVLTGGDFATFGFYDKKSSRYFAGGFQTDWGNRKSKYNQRTMILSSAIYFNPRFCINKDKFDYDFATRAIEGQKSYFHLPSKETGAYIAGTHELGHTVNDVIDQFLNAEEKEEIETLKLLDSNGVKQKAKTLYENGEISGYAYKNQAIESISEAFADYYSNREKATVHNKAIIEFYKKMYKKYFNS